MHLEHPVFEIVTTTAGAISIRNKIVNEIMHNPVGPWVEANALYIDQSDLKEKLSQKTTEEFVVFDIGLGAAANALAALACAKSVQNSESRPFRIVSFEIDLELLKFALAHANQFAHFHSYEQALQQLLDKGHWSEGSLSWDLREGNFLEKIKEEIYRPHVIFFDPYSPKMNQDMWTIDSFTNLRNKSREPHEGGTSLYTYSQATQIRVALIKAGFFVGYGDATGLKDETTAAATDLKLLKSPLDKVWFERWGRSGKRYPLASSPEEYAAIDACIEAYAKAGYFSGL